MDLLCCVSSSRLGLGGRRSLALNDGTSLARDQRPDATKDSQVSIVLCVLRAELYGRGRHSAQSFVKVRVSTERSDSSVFQRTGTRHRRRPVWDYDCASETVTLGSPSFLVLEVFCSRDDEPTLCGTACISSDVLLNGVCHPGEMGPERTLNLQAGGEAATSKQTDTITVRACCGRSDEKALFPGAIKSCNTAEDTSTTTDSFARAHSDSFSSSSSDEAMSPAQRITHALTYSATKRGFINQGHTLPVFSMFSGAKLEECKNAVESLSVSHLSPPRSQRALDSKPISPRPVSPRPKSPRPISPRPLSSVVLDACVATDAVDHWWRSNTAPTPLGPYREDNGTMLENLAERVRGTLTKYPLTRAWGAFSKPTDRYFAVKPQGDSPTGESDPRARWERPQLAYWEDQAAWEGREAPYGAIALSLISNVKTERLSEKSELESTLVRLSFHCTSDGATSHLILRFPSVERAKGWCEALESLIAVVKEMHL